MKRPGWSCNSGRAYHGKDKTTMDTTSVTQRYQEAYQALRNECATERERKALDRAQQLLNSRAWKFDGDALLISSSSGAGQYLVTLHGCPCQAGAHGRPCKHKMLFSIVRRSMERALKRKARSYEEALAAGNELF
jgi:hypothetical protein